MMESFQRENLWNYHSEFDNFEIFNTLSNTFQQIRPVSVDSKLNFMSVFSTGTNCKDSLRLLSTQYMEQQESKQEIKSKYFCMYSQNELTHEKKYALLPYGVEQKKMNRVELALDKPSKVIVINNSFLVAIEKICITLYRIHNENLILKDFDSVGIGSQFIVVELQHLKYKGQDYLLVFGNQKEDVKPYFKCLVYQLEDEKLKFIKKASLFEREYYRPIIVFDTYPDKQFKQEQFCLIIGGFQDYQQQNYNFSALQIHLHLLIEQWIEYPIKLTRQIIFHKKHTLTSGKGLKITADISRDEFWLLFCTQYQTITKMDITFGNHDSSYSIQSIDFDTKALKIRDQVTGQFEPIFYSLNTIYLVRAPEDTIFSKQQIPYRIYWCSKQMNKVASRPLEEMLKLFCHN